VAIDEFLNPDWSADVHDPFLFKDMARAVDRIYACIAQGELIYVYGDYDADGVTGSVVLVSTLRKLGARVEVYLPHREREGYGINEAAVRYIKDHGGKLIISCDCGVANVAEIKLAGELGMDVIVTDHHQPGEALPAALAIIHPTVAGENYLGKTLSGGAVAFKLVQGLLRTDKCTWSDKVKESWEKWLLDLVAISLVADMVPLVGEARTLAKYGLIVLQKTKRLGLQKMYDLASIRPDKITTYTIGWQIAPRINAAGRMDHANAGYALLMSDSVREAEELAAALNSANTERQRLTDVMVDEALAQIGSPKTSDFCITATKPEWPLGLIGLVAGKLVQVHSRPALVMGEDGNHIVGSGRGVEGFDLMQALTDSREYLIKFGGHKQAAGFRLERKNYEPFIKNFKQVCKKQLKGKDLTPTLNVDMSIEFPELDWKLYDQVAVLEPTGQANPSTIFVTEDVEVGEIQTVGSNSQHQRLILQQGDTSKKFIMFNADKKGTELKIGDKIDIAYDVGVNEWNGNRELQLKIIDFKKST